MSLCVFVVSGCLLFVPQAPCLWFMGDYLGCFFSSMRYKNRSVAIKIVALQLSVEALELIRFCHVWRQMVCEDTVLVVSRVAERADKCLP